ncbi:response regulator [Myroides sp. DW712]|uniref:response regulator n=1 Tax=Myroides sp. DW712 TaxID=3389800 RepID=UPI00397A425C
MSFTLLIIDDHQMIVDWYKYVLQQVYQDAIILSATVVEEGLEHVNQCEKLDLVVVDYNLGKRDTAMQITNGVEFVAHVKKKFPQVDVILITGHEGTLVLYTIHKKIVPQALLLKIDVTEGLLKKALQVVGSGERFYSLHANEALKEVYKKEALLQEQNVQILLLLDRGFKIKEISETLFLSESAVNKRIAGLKQVFDVMDNGGLVKKVKEEGFI